jgi:hypothetical protein
MNKPVSIALLVVGIVLLILGFNASSSMTSDISRAFTGTPTDRSIWFLVGGAVAAIVGLFGLLSGRGSKPL